MFCYANTSFKKIYSNFGMLQSVIRVSDARFDILLQKATFEGLNECEINVMVKGMISHDLNYVLFPTVMLFLLVFNIPGFTNMHVWHPERSQYQIIRFVIHRSIIENLY